MIVPFHPNDTDSLVEIWQAATVPAHPFLSPTFLAEEAEALRNLYLPRTNVWVAREAERPTGFIALSGSEVAGLFVAPDRQRRGLGRALITHAADRLGHLTVEVFALNIGARQFYRRMGFAEISRRNHDTLGETLILMSTGCPPT